MFTTDWFFNVLNAASCGAYAVDLDRTILFWNRSAERILGHKAEEVVGLRCCRPLQDLPEEDSTLICLDGCPSVEFARAGLIPPVMHARMLCASGQSKLLAVTPLVTPLTQVDRTVLVRLFHEPDDVAKAGTVAKTAGDALGGPPPQAPNGLAVDTPDGAVSLTVRETEVLRLVSRGMSTREIASGLHLSTHTVQNYVRNAREKLQARTKLAAVMAAQRLGLL